jgi:hypothetical protein
MAMDAQPLSREVSNRPSPAAPPPHESGWTAPAPIWLQRVSLMVLVVFCLYLGGLLVYLPWWKPMWDNNALLLDFPRLHHYLTQGPVRGLVSGLGLLDLWIGLSEIVHYQEYRS